MVGSRDFADFERGVWVLSAIQTPRKVPTMQKRQMRSLGFINLAWIAFNLVCF